MVDLKNFEQLEIKIEKLINQITSLKEHNKALTESLSQKDQDIQKLTNNIETLNKEKSIVYTKVADLIEKLEAIDVSD